MNGNTNPTYQLSLPAKAQGVTFYKMYGDTYMTINASLGRKSDSTVYVYKSKGYASGLNLSLSCTKKITMPCMLEESIQYKGYTYCVFESCGNVYRNGTDGNGYAEYVIGQVCGFSNSFILK